MQKYPDPVVFDKKYNFTSLYSPNGNYHKAISYWL